MHSNERISAPPSNSISFNRCDSISNIKVATLSRAVTASRGGFECQPVQIQPYHLPYPPISGQ